MRFIDRLTAVEPIEEAFSGRGAHGGRASDFQRRHYNYFGKKIQEIQDPIIREHFATWLAKILAMQRPQYFVDAVMKKDLYSERTPEFQMRHYWFFADELKALTNPWFWKFAYDWTERMFNSQENFKNDKFEQHSTPEDFRSMADW